MLRLRTLGTLDLRNADGSELRHVLTQPRRLALLIYLISAKPRAFQRRDMLLTLFWADRSLDRARASLSRAVYFLRRELGSHIILSRGDEDIGLSPGTVWCDALAFDQALEQGDLEAALSLYQGEFLPGFFAPDAKGFEEWLEHERARLRERASGAAAELAVRQEQAGDLPQAVEWARWSVARSPFSEVALQRLLVLLDRCGDRAEANRAYQEFADRIASELDLVPSPETESLIRVIRARNHPNGGIPAEAREVAAHPAEPPPAWSGTKEERSLSNISTRWARRVLLAGAVLAGCGIYAFARVRRPAVRQDLVSVAPFTVARPDQPLSAQGRMAGDHLVEALAATGLVRIAAGSETRRAGIVVNGALDQEDGRVRIEARISSPGSRRMVWTILSQAVPVDSFDRAMSEVSRRVTGGVVALALPRFADWFPVASSPPVIEAFLELAQADQLQSRGADREALPHLERAVALDSSFVWARLQLTAAHLALFDSEHSTPLIAAMHQNRDRLTLLQRHWLDWMRAVMAEDVVGAYTALGAAAGLAPQRFLYDQARWATFLNRPRETIELLDRLGADSPYNGGTPGYWRHLTRSYHALENYQGELATARRARRYPVAPIVVRAFEGIALAAMGRTHELRALVDTALTLPVDRGTSPRQLMAESGTSPAQLMVLVAEELRAHGYEGEADEMLDRAAAWYAAQPPDQAGERARRFDLGMAAYYARDWARADTIFRSLLVEDPDNFVYLGRLGTIAARLGNETGARDILRRFDRFRSTLHMPHTSVGYWQSKITMLLGDEQRAMTLMTEAVGPQGRGGMHADFDFERIWNTRLFRDFVRPKG